MSDHDDDDDRLVEDENAPKVQVFHRINRLQRKAVVPKGDESDFLSKERLQAADAVVEAKKEEYGDEVKHVIEDIEAAWAKVQDKEQSSQDGLRDLYHEANHIKDLASTFGYELMQHFGNSLRNFAEKIDLSNQAHHTIVKAHIDVMWVAYHENIKDHGGEKAEELKKFVAKAIEKYS